MWGSSSGFGSDEETKRVKRLGLAEFLKSIGQGAIRTGFTGDYSNLGQGALEGQERRQQVLTDFADHKRALQAERARRFAELDGRRARLQDAVDAGAVSKKDAASLGILLQQKDWDDIFAKKVTSRPEPKRMTVGGTVLEEDENGKLNPVYTSPPKPEKPEKPVTQNWADGTTRQWDPQTQKWSVLARRQPKAPAVKTDKVEPAVDAQALYSHVIEETRKRLGVDDPNNIDWIGKSPAEIEVVVNQVAQPAFQVALDSAKSNAKANAQRVVLPVGGQTATAPEPPKKIEPMPKTLSSLVSGSSRMKAFAEQLRAQGMSWSEIEDGLRSHMNR